MGSKGAILILGLLAMVFLISSEVAARDLAEASSKKGEVGKEANEVGDGKYGGHGGGFPPIPRGRQLQYCPYNCCYRSLYGGPCTRCCSYAGEAVEAQTEVKPPN